MWLEVATVRLLRAMRAWESFARWAHQRLRARRHASQFAFRRLTQLFQLSERHRAFQEYLRDCEQRSVQQLSWQDEHEPEHEPQP